MAQLISLALVGVILILGARRRPENLPLPAGIRLLFVTGSEFLFVGALLGTNLLGVLDAEVLEGLKPLTALAMGFVGLHYGLQLEAKLLRWIPLFYNVAPLAQALGAALLVFAPSYLLLSHFYARNNETLVAALVLAAAAACSTPAPLDLLARDRRYQSSPRLLMLRHLAEMGELPALALFGIAVCLRHEAGVAVGWSFAPTLQWLGLTALLGVVFGLVLDILPAVGKDGTGRLVVGGLGALLFFTGLARYLLLSPLFVSLIAGILVANIPGPSKRLRRFVSRTEAPFSLFLLLIAGASWRLDLGDAISPWLMLLLALALMIFRLAGKTIACMILARTTLAHREPTRWLGLGLVAQGGISAAIALDYLDGGTGPASAIVFSMILLSIIVTETVAPWLILRSMAADRLLQPPSEQNA